MVNFELVLSLFPGIGLLDIPFEESGYCVVRGPDKLWGGDIKKFHVPAGKFDGVIGGPPCKAFSRLVHIVKQNHKREPDKYHVAENLIPEFVRVVKEAQPTWWLMENVPGVPREAWPQVDGYHVRSFILNNRWLPDTTPQNRERRFWFAHKERCIDLTAFMDFALFEPVEWEHAVTASSSGGGRAVPVKLGANGTVKRTYQKGSNQRTVQDYLRLQGLPDGFFDKDTPFTVKGQQMMLGNGVPLPTGRAIAKAVRAALEAKPVEAKTA